MYSLIGRLFEGKSLNIISTPPVSFVFDFDIFLIGILLAAGLFVLISRMKCRNYPVPALIAAGVVCSVAAYLVQTYMYTWFPELFIPGGPYGTWFEFRNELSGILGYAAILLGALVPAWFLAPRIRLSAAWNALLIFSTLIATSVLYYSYVFSVTMTPGSGISVPEWLMAVSPVLASAAIAAGVLGWGLVIREFFDLAGSWPVRIIGIAAITASAILLTYPTAVSVYAVIAWLMIAKGMDRLSQVHRLFLAAVMICFGAACELIGSFFAAMGPDAGRFVPVWLFPVLFMALVLLVPGLWSLPAFNPKYRIIAVFGVSLGTGVLIALASAIIPPNVFLQSDLLPQTTGSVLVNLVLGLGIAAILYSGLRRFGRKFRTRRNSMAEAGSWH